MSRSDLELRSDWLSKASILTDALPFMRRYADSRVVVKFGGHAMGDDGLFKTFASDMVLLRQVGTNPIVVHGGGPQIGLMLERMAIKSEFIDGLRVTDKATVEIVEMVLAGSINKSIVASINGSGGKAVGISGKDANLLTVKKLMRKSIDPDSNIEKVVDLGFVGEPKAVDSKLINTLIADGFIPVIAPVGYGEDGETYNVNADTAAGAIAGATGAQLMLRVYSIGMAN